MLLVVASFVVDPDSSRVRIHLGRSGLLKFLGHDHTIEAPLAEGRIEADTEDVQRSRVRLRWEARRLAVVPGTEPAKDVPEVEARMRGPEVLDVERYPGIVFSASAVVGEAVAPGRYRLRMRGVLELRGRKQEIELPLEVRRDADVLTATGQVALRLSEVGISPPSVAGVVKVANRFLVTFEVRADLAAPAQGAGTASYTRRTDTGPPMRPSRRGFAPPLVSVRAGEAVNRK